MCRTMRILHIVVLYYILIKVEEIYVIVSNTELKPGNSFALLLHWPMHTRAHAHKHPRNESILCKCELIHRSAEQRKEKEKVENRRVHYTFTCDTYKCINNSEFDLGWIYSWSTPLQQVVCVCVYAWSTLPGVVRSTD